MNIKDLKPGSYKIISNPTNIKQLAPGSFKTISQVIKEHNDLGGNSDSESQIQPTFKASIGGAETIIPNSLKTIGNIPSDALNIGKTAIDSTMGKLPAIGQAAKDFASTEKANPNGGAGQAAKDLAGGVADTLTKDFKAPGEFLVNSNEKSKLTTLLSPIQEQALKQRDEILQKLTQEKSQGKDTSHLVLALKYNKDTLDSLNTQIGSKDNRENKGADEVSNVIKYPIEHPVQVAIAAEGLKPETQSTISDTIKPISDKVESTINTIKNAPKNTFNAVAEGEGITAKAARRVKDVQENKAQLSEQPKVIQNSVKADIPQAQAEFIHETTSEEKNLMKDMLEKQKNGVKKNVMTPSERPDAVIGKETMKPVKFLEDQKKLAIQEEGNHVKNLTDKQVDYSKTVSDFKDRLSTLGVNEGEDGRLDFSKSELSTPSSSKDRGLLQLTADELKPNEAGEYVKPASELHTIRQRLFNETQNKNFTEPFTDRIVSMVHNDTGTSVRSGLLHDINGQAGITGKGYTATVTRNAKIQDALETFYKLVGKDAAGKEVNIQNLKAGEVANRIAGNASANVENALYKIETLAKELGYTSDVSVRKLVAFKTMLKNIVGETQANSLAGAIEQGNKAAAADGAEIFGNIVKGEKIGTAKAVLKFVKGNSRAEQIRALEELLNSPGPTRDFVRPGEPF